jgi:hypothetical protein
LPEPVLRRDVALSEEQILQARGLDRGNAVRVSGDFHRPRQTSHKKISVKLGQGRSSDQKNECDCAYDNDDQD